MSEPSGAARGSSRGAVLTVLLIAALALGCGALIALLLCAAPNL